MAAATAANLLVVAMLSRTAGAGELGVYLVAITIAQMASMILGAGIDTATVYYAADAEPGRGRDVAVASLQWAAALGVTAALVTGVLVGLLATNDRVVILATAVALPGHMLFRHVEAILRARRQVTPVVVARVLQALVIALGAVVLAALGRLDMVTATLLWGLGWYLALVVAVSGGRPILGTEAMAPHSEAWHRPLFTFGLRGHGGTVAQQLVYRADLLIVSAFAGQAAAGLYGVVGRIVDLLWYVPSAANFDLLPRVVQERGRDRGATLAIADRVAIAVGGVLTTAALMLWLFGDIFVEVAFGSELLPAVAWLRILLPGAVLFGVAKVYAQELIGNGRPGTNTVISLVAMLVVVGAGLVIIPVHGGAGAAWVSTIIYSVQAVATLGAARRSRTGADVLEGSAP